MMTLVRFCLTLFFLSALPAIAAPINVTLMMGGNDTSTAADAVRLLTADPALHDVKFKLYSMLDFPAKTAVNTDTKPVSFITQSQFIFISTSVGRSFITLAGNDIKQATEHGSTAYVLGSVWDKDFPSFGLTKSEPINAYKQAGGAANMANMVRTALAKSLNLANVPPPEALPELAYFNPVNNRNYPDLKSYQQDCQLCQPDKDWIGILIYRNTALSGNNETVLAVAKSLVARGLNPLIIYGTGTNQPIEKLLLDETGKSRVQGILSLAGKFDMSEQKTVPLLKKLNVPVLNLVSLQTQSLKQFTASTVGLDIMERSWQIGSTELGGAIAPTVIAVKERRHDDVLDITYDLDVPIPERIERATDRIHRFVEIHKEENRNKRVAIIYYNYPPGKENVGASYLNVLPKSLWSILQRLKAEGYETGTSVADETALFNTIQDHGTNIDGHAAGALEALVRGGNATLLPVSTYEKWLAELPETLRSAMINYWGKPDQAKAMLWRDAKGVAYFVFPSVRLGNIMFSPEPDRIGSVDPTKLYHDVHMPPHHQYVAYYLWLQHDYKAHAMVHVGTHATHEWHGGREVGFLADDPGEVFVGAVPQLYPYIVDDIGEGIQAKRRGMAALISHLTPPLDKAVLNVDLVKLMGLISDYRVAVEKGPVAASAILGDLSTLAVKTGVAKDLGFTAINNEEQMEAIEDHLNEIGKANAPYGLHTFGVSPDEHARQNTAEAMLSIDTSLSPEQREAKKQDYMARLESSGKAELDALINGLNGQYIAAGSGNDPVRNPDSLPTGRNLFGFDPSRLPTPATYEIGAKQAEELIEDYRKRHEGQYPDKLSFNLWGVESYRHEGVIEAEIMRLLGVKPVWDARGLVTGVEAISQKDLGRPRVDVVMIPTGMYRDQFAPLMLLLDKAVTAARLADNENALAKNYQKALTALLKRGIPKAQAERLAGVRLFSEPTGVYGTNLTKVIPKSNTWKQEHEVSDVFLNRLGNPFGQGYWGGVDVSGKDGQASTDKQIDATLGVDLFKLALTDVKATIHSSSSNIYKALDNDDVYQYLGGAAMAVRAVNGKSPEVLIANLSDPKNPHHETAEKFIGREMRSRYLNPKWIESMLKEGYGGARFVGMVTENLWGWEVTAPEVIGDQLWQEMYETYVADRNGLDIKQKFRDAKNLLAYQGLIDRMITAINKGYWKADAATKAALEKANLEVIAEAGVACDQDSCSSAKITELGKEQDRKIGEAAAKLPAPSVGTQASKPADSVKADVQAQPQASVSTAQSKPQTADAPPAPNKPAEVKDAQAKTAQVDGYEMTEKKSAADANKQAMESAINWLGALFLVIFAVGVLVRRT